MKIFNFCMKLQWHEHLKLTEIFFSEKLGFEVFGPKGAQNRPNIRFFKFYEKSIHGPFLVFG